MNRLSTHNKYVLKEGKYVRQSAEDQQLFSHRSRSDANNSVEGQTKTLINVDDNHLNLYNSSRQPLLTQMTSSIILPRNFEYVPKHFASKKIGKDLYSSGRHSPIKLDRELHGQLHSSRVVEAPKLLRIPFESMLIDTKSNCSDDSHYIEMARDKTESKALLQNETNTSRIHNFKSGQLQLRLRIGSTELPGNISERTKEKGDQYRMSPQQQVVWLKRMLEDKTNDTEKLFNENGSLKTEIAFLKERIISFQRANHILEMENAKIKMQLFSQEELIQLCCPEQGLGSYSGKDISTSQLEQELQRIKAEIHQLETQGSYSDTRSEMLNYKSGTHTNQKMLYLKKMLADKKNVLDAYHIGSESKESMKRYITNIIQRSKADHKIIVQLRNQINSKEKIITEMDQLIHDISQQLASYKKVDIERPKTISKSMRESFITSATSIGTGRLPSDSRLNFNILNSSIMKLKESHYDCGEHPSVRIIEPEDDDSRVKKRVNWNLDDSDLTVRKLMQQMNEKERLIEYYQDEFMRLGYKNQESIYQNYGKVATEISEVDYSPKVNRLSSLLKMKEKKIGGENSKAIVLSVKRASIH